MLRRLGWSLLSQSDHTRFFRSISGDESRLVNRNSGSVNRFARGTFRNLGRPRWYHPRMQDAIAARAVAFPLYNAGSVAEFLENEKILSPIKEALSAGRDTTTFSLTTGVESAPTRPLRLPQRLQTRLQLSTSPALRSFYTNAWGKLRIGRVLEDLDALAGSIALRHVALPDVNTVTACVDKIRVLYRHQPGDNSDAPRTRLEESASRPPWSILDSDLVYTGHLFHVGKTSMTISCEVSRADRDCPSFLEASFVFVARDATGQQSIQVPGLLLKTKADHEAFALGERMARERRKERRHQNRPVHTVGLSNGNITEEAETLEQSDRHPPKMNDGAALDFANCADPTSVSIDETMMRTVHIVQPDVRNLFGFMFGGTILLWAFELAYLNVIRHVSMSVSDQKEVTAPTSYQSIVPRLCAIGDIAFHRPVPIGSVLEMCSRIVAVHDHDVAVRLSARLWSVGGLVRQTSETDANLITNTMTFLFQVPRGELDPIMPSLLRPVYATNAEQALESQRAATMFRNNPQ
jgi:acyl-CoA hydrolase